MATMTCTSSLYPSDSGVMRTSIPPPSPKRFALARIKGDVHLVQVSQHLAGTTAFALSVVDVNIFRHEFTTIFRYSHHDTIHPADIQIIETVDDSHVLYEEENGTAFLARGVIERLQKVTPRISPVTRVSTSRYRRRV
ncbi:hypothetical protein JAAARDRAFT_32434 [Jaapia argillacea MUCL 33604]|uniref:Uncharacterized protein n=1 Tax=Jaapia argillacea MUCL 33604 TaxID=933084 RepID=A0A067QBT2_9AGAM|nr:hypothetical protein JAAARDRAFT_32434 [Jaapia argillacea MUCL 33604]